MKKTIAVGRIHAKTGSVEHVRTRSGFAETPAGRELIFSFLGNNQGGKNHEATDALDALCVAMLEEFDPKPQKPGRRDAREWSQAGGDTRRREEMTTGENRHGVWQFAAARRRSGL